MQSHDEPDPESGTYEEKPGINRQYLHPCVRVWEFGRSTGSTALAHAPHAGFIEATDISAENGGENVVHGSGGMMQRRAAKRRPGFALSGGREGGGVFTVELYRKVRPAYFRQGMSKRVIARHFCISRDSVDKMIV